MNKGMGVCFSVSAEFLDRLAKEVQEEPSSNLIKRPNHNHWLCVNDFPSCVKCYCPAVQQSLYFPSGTDAFNVPN